MIQQLPWAACSSASASKPFNFPFHWQKLSLFYEIPERKFILFFYINMKINNASLGSCVPFWMLSRFL